MQCKSAKVLQACKQNLLTFLFENLDNLRMSMWISYLYEELMENSKKAEVRNVPLMRTQKYKKPSRKKKYTSLSNSATEPLQ